MDRKDIERLQKIDDRSQENSKRLDELEPKVENIHELASSVNTLAIEVKAMREEMNKIDNRIAVIEQKPNKRYEAVIMQIISFIVEAILVIVAVKIGLK